MKKQCQCQCGAPATLRYCLIENWNKVIEVMLCARCASDKITSDKA